MKIALVIMLTVFLFCGCGNDSVAGNSSETGNCRVVGVVSHPVNTTFKPVPVVLLPSDYTVKSGDAVPETTWTSQTGSYHFDNVDPGIWTVSVQDTGGQLGMIHQDIELEQGDTANIEDTLLETGTVKVITTNDSLVITVGVKGTPWSSSSVPISRGTNTSREIYLSSVPTNDSISLIAETDEGLLFENVLLPVANDTLNVASKNQAILISGAGETEWKAQWSGVISHTGYAPIEVFDTAVSSATFEDAGLIIIVGNPELPEDILSYLAGTSLSIVNAVPYLFPALGMTDTVVDFDFGYHINELLLFAPVVDHPILSQLPEPKAIADTLFIDTTLNVSWGIPLLSAKQHTLVSKEPDQSTCFSYEKGDQLLTGPASGRRVGINIPGITVSEDELWLVIGAIEWAGYTVGNSRKGLNN